MSNTNLNPESSQKQADAILAALQQGTALTALDAIKYFGCMRLGARVYDLKKQGYQIKSQMVTVPSGKRVAQYSLISPKATDQAA
jgi:hypothetical protein